MTDEAPMTTGPAPAPGERDLSILLIDDDTELCELVQEFFVTRGMRVESIHDGRRGLAQAFEQRV